VERVDVVCDFDQSAHETVAVQVQVGVQLDVVENVDFLLGILLSPRRQYLLEQLVAAEDASAA